MNLADGGDNVIDVASLRSTIGRNAMLSIVEFLDRKNRGSVNIVDLRELFELAVLQQLWMHGLSMWPLSVS